MLQSASWPRAVESGLWQNCSCGSIGIPHEARFGDHAWRNAWWTRAFQRVTLPPHGSLGCYQAEYREHQTQIESLEAGIMKLFGLKATSNDATLDRLYDRQIAAMKDD